MATVRLLLFFSLILVSGEAFAQIQDHNRQFGLRIGATTGISYKTCYESGKTDVGRSTASAISKLSYGVTSSIEIEAGAETGFERDYPVTVTAGIRYFYNPLSFLKFFSTIETLFPVRPFTDFGIRNEDGIQYDFNEHVGIWASAILSLTFVHGFGASAGVAAGLQFRM